MLVAMLVGIAYVFHYINNIVVLYVYIISPLYPHYILYTLIYPHCRWLNSTQGTDGG